MPFSSASSSAGVSAKSNSADRSTSPSSTRSAAEVDRDVGGAARAPQQRHREHGQQRPQRRDGVAKRARDRCGGWAACRRNALSAGSRRHGVAMRRAQVRCGVLPTSALAKQRVEEPVLIVARAFRRRQELAVAMRYAVRKGEGFAQRIGHDSPRNRRCAPRSPRRTPSTSRRAACRPARGAATPRRGGATARARSARRRPRGAAICRPDGGARRPTPCTARRAGCGRTRGRPTTRPASPASPCDEADTAVGKLQAHEILVDAREPRRIDVERQQVDVRAFEDMRRLAAGCGARVEHAHAVVNVEQRRRELRRQVLHGERTLGKARQLGHRPRRGDDHAGRTRRFRRHAGCREALQQLVASDDAAIDAQRERRPRVARFEDRLPVGRMVAPHAIDPPARVRPARDVVRRAPTGARRPAHAGSGAAARSPTTWPQGGRLRRPRPPHDRRRRTPARACDRAGRARRRSARGAADRRSAFARGPQRSRRACPNAAACRRRAPAPACGRATGSVVDGCQRFAQIGAIENARDGQRRQYLLMLHRGLIGRPRRNVQVPCRARPRTRARTSFGRPPAARPSDAARPDSSRDRRRRRCLRGSPR